MQAFLSLTTLVAAAAARPQVAGQIRLTGQGAPTLVRAPAHDSASIEHHRLGGNFAYSTAEAHAFASVTPEISVLTHPVAETTHTHIPAPIATHQPAPIVRTTHVAQPVFKNIPTFGTQAIHGPVRTHQTVSQPIVHETRTHSVQAISQAHHPPVHAVRQAVVGVAAAPVASVGYAAAAPAAVAHPAYAGYNGFAGYAAAAPAVVA